MPVLPMRTSVTQSGRRGLRVVSDIRSHFHEKRSCHFGRSKGNTLDFSICDGGNMLADMVD